MESIRTKEIRRWYKLMDIDQAIKTLQDHNQWRRGVNGYEMCHPEKLGCAIDIVCESAKNKPHSIDFKTPFTFSFWSEKDVKDFIEKYPNGIKMELLK